MSLRSTAETPRLANALRTMNSSQEAERDRSDVSATVESISAVTLATREMATAVRFYSRLGFQIRYGGETAPFTSFVVGPNYLNLIAQPREQGKSWWGRVIFYVSDVDAFYLRAKANGLMADTAPRDASWGERYFHITDPDGHELSFARLL